MAAPITRFLMTAQSSGATPLDGFDHSTLLPRQGGVVASHEFGTEAADDVGQFERGLVDAVLFHTASFLSVDLDSISRSSGLGVLCRHCCER